MNTNASLYTNGMSVIKANKYYFMRLVFIIFLVTFFVYKHTKFSHIAVVVILFLFITVPIKSKYTFIPGIILLTLSLFVAFFHHDTLARGLSIYAFYFMIISVISQLRTKTIEVFALITHQPILQQLQTYFTMET